MPKPIVLVEDDPDVREELATVLREEGFVVHSVANGRDALYLLNDIGGEALVLLDLMMPVLSGWEVLEWLRRIGATCPVIVLSAVGDASRVPGAVAYVGKPWKMEELMPLVRQHAE